MRAVAGPPGEQYGHDGTIALVAREFDRSRPALGSR